MKKMTLSGLAIILFASITHAQISKGAIYLGGNIGASTVKQNVDNSATGGKRHTVYINPAAGIAIKNNLIAGVDLSYTNSQSKNYLNYQDYENHTYGGGVFLRKYMAIVNRFYFFAESGLHYSQNKYRSLATPSSSYFSEANQKTIAATLYPGLALHIFKSFYMETSFPDLLELGYSQATNKSNPYGSAITAKDKSFFFDAGLLSTINLNIGLRFIIPKK